MKKWIIIVGSVLVVGFVGYRWDSLKLGTQTVSAQVRTAVVQKGTLNVNISGSGTVQAVTSEDIKTTFNNNEVDEVLAAVGENVTEGDELITFSDGSDPITAPATGVITTIAVSAGEPVTNGQVVAHVTNYKQLQTVVQIDELDISKIKKNQPVDLTINAFPDQVFTGKVSAISEDGASSNGVSTFDVTISIDKPDQLKVGMSAEARILTESKVNALYVPLDAVYTSNNKKYVIVNSKSTDSNTSGTEKNTVQTGIANEDYVEITKGVSEGETVKLPQLAKASSSNNSSSNSQSSVFGGIGNVGGMNRNFGGQGQFGGRGGN
ncbi:efflux RND transporter periplasmic adaptor subunit [Bacillus sp. ISL-40]|uniref:efflux RND transporter periplasmic adaptor subunit n=1 Tax=unclassified Bacillus (in: firmicutes) TaxID=185979 RepID=UPI001BE919FC|nr:MULTISPECIES: efflux RND transporter periplasmic adaptor subunit [unclassified Bacillus (in: firmicutes)]MBT2696719.1 efflux RND transporter periplasmic adaptor subunit [Bacillus sp. ISL-40]MBT2721278.1 efflux RND transporter periplasmic adaptor subunit [Bacillus sp. ISL-46]MBT2740036.1 efflux RND transporter periplasmic adaptor subunit [Bacillus sp. ISL-77]